MKWFYEPKFYEVRALAYLAQLIGKPIVANLRLPLLNIPYHDRPEIDGYVEIENEDWAIEVKSYPLNTQDVGQIVQKYTVLGFERVMIVAPTISTNASECHSCRIQAISFIPDLLPILNYYKHDLLCSPWVQNEIRTGWHHFRYMLAERSNKQLRWMLNQTDKRINNINKLQTEITNRVISRTVPIRVYWSINQWQSPKELYFIQQPHMFIRRRVVFDIDGDQIHRPFFPCVYNSKGLCEYCFFFAKENAMRLIELLNNYGYFDLMTVFSGWRGFHIYILDDNIQIEQINTIVEDALSRKIHIDQRVTLDSKGVIGAPGTLHGYSMKPLIEVEDLVNFTWEKLQTL